MSKIVATAAIRGAKKIVAETEEFLNRALKEKGPEAKLEFPETAFFLPMAKALLNADVKTLDEATKILEHSKSLLPQEPSEHLWLPYLGNTLDAGMAALFSEEILMALRYLYGQEPQDGCNGFFSDTVMRSLGIQLVDGRMPGFAAILGAAPNNQIAVDIVRQLQERSILIFVGSSTNGVSIIDQLKEEGVEMGWDSYIVPYGRDTVSGIYALNWAIRAALTFGGIKPGEAKKCLEYTKERVFAFGLTLGEVDDIKYATGAGAINMGFPIIADTDIPEIHPSGITIYEALVKELDYKKIVPRCITVRGFKVKVSKIPIPVLYGPAFEGERVRKENLYVEFGGKKAIAFEFLKYVDMDKIEDGNVELIGPDIDNIKDKSLPLGIVVEVGSRNANEDFEPILERQIHRYINEAQGIMHIGQRDIMWIRISQEGFKKGLRLKHIGTIIHAQIHQEYSAIVDKVQVKIYSKMEDVEKQLTEARRIFGKRDERIGGMTDESVEDFYSCALCQSFAPNHICIVTPERLGLCGAYSWLDAKANYQISPAGANQPIKKGPMLDEKLGQWKNINDFVYEKSNKTIEKVSMYSLLESPQTSCGCFECIVALVPEANGFLVVNRDYTKETPLGMTFTTLAGSVGGGVQTPGFLGVGRLYLISKKFILAEGGLKRIVWLPQELKEFLHSKLDVRAKEMGVSDFVNKIADETKATTIEQLIEFLNQVKHPALEMSSLI
ncbi:MAG: CO dehydrogenase/CO-methylating acetyl-CoA synthase complex subunit beta [Candidatus Omnitrophica bacterium]|nr:CO dehydrogenase/CO-methylating acetyl-CoA synthase complex subunit beta [Candidatus Omnitrophota bacterium]